MGGSSTLSNDTSDYLNFSRSRPYEAENANGDSSQLFYEVDMNGNEEEGVLDDNEIGGQEDAEWCDIRNTVIFGWRIIVRLCSFMGDLHL